MAKENLVVNGYKVPGGMSGVAVRRACELVIASPGITQKDLLEGSVMYSGLNFSTAGWITSPGPKSPATLLWDRRKEGVFKCYPNEHTDRVVGAEAAMFDERVLDFRRQTRGFKWLPKPGDLVRSTTALGDVYAEGIILGWAWGNLRAGDVMFNSPEDLIAARPPTDRGSFIYVNILENSSGRVVKEWRFGNILPV